jgi:hypothetical protein
MGMRDKNGNIATLFKRAIIIVLSLYVSIHHQPINVSTAGAQAFLIDYPQEERAITHHAGPVRIGAFQFNNTYYKSFEGDISNPNF